VAEPGRGDVARYEELRRRYQRYDVELLKLRELPGETLDSYRVGLEANIELPEEIPSVLEHGAEGIGLYRTEFLYLNRKDLPTEEEHYTIYRHLTEAISPRPATIRTFDLGGDKFLSQVSLAKEMNPALGLRAIRFCLREIPDLQDPACGNPPRQRPRPAQDHVPHGLGADRAPTGQGGGLGGEGGPGPAGRPYNRTSRSAS